MMFPIVRIFVIFPVHTYTHTRNLCTQVCMYADKPKFCMCSFPHYLIQITCLEVVLIATIKMHDEWEGLARMLADLITKYADVLEDQDKPNLSNEEEQQDAA